MQDRYGKSQIIKTIALTHYSTKEIKRMANYSICLCPICLNNDRNMVWHQRSETWYCESCYDQLVADKISDDLRKKVLQLQDNERFDELYDCNNFLTQLPLTTLARLLLDPDINFIEFIVEEKTKRKFNWRRDSAEIGMRFHKDEELISQIISKQVVNVLSKAIESEIESVFRLGLHQGIHLRDFVALSHEVKEFFFVSAHKYSSNHFPDNYPAYDELGLQLIKLLESEYIRQHVAKVLKKEEPEAVRELFERDWLYLLNKSDFLSLCNASGLNLYDAILDLNKDLDEYAESIELPQGFPKLIRQNLSEKVKKIIKKRDKKLIKTLFRLGIFNKISYNVMSDVKNDHEFIEILYELREECGSDSFVGKPIYKFFKESVLKAPLKQMIVDRFMEGNYEKIYKAWKLGWISTLSENDLCDLLEQRELHFLDNLLLAFHYHGYERDRYYCERGARYLFPFFNDFPLVNSKVGKALKPHVIEVIENGKKESLVPLVAMGYMYLLDPKEIVSFFEDPELKLFTKLYIAHKHYPWEFSYFNEDFYAFRKTFNTYLEHIGLEKVFYDDDDDIYDENDYKPTFKVNYDITIKKDITQRNQIKFLTKNIEQRILNKKEFSEEELKAFPKNVENIDSKSKNCQVEVILVESLDHYEEIYEDSTQFGLYCLQYGISLMEHGKLVEAGETLNAVHGSEGWDSWWPFTLFQKARIAAILGEIEYLIEFLERALRTEFALERNTRIHIYKSPNVRISRSDIKEQVENSLEFQRYESYIKQTLAHDYDNEEDNEKFWQGNY